MKGINLLPKELRRRREEGRLARRWGWSCAAYVAALLLVAVSVQVSQRLDDRFVRAEITRVSANAGALEGRQETLSGVLKRVAGERSLRETVNSPADYAQLLAVLGQSMQGEAVLTQLRCEVSPSGPAVVKAGSMKNDPLANPLQMKLELSGLVREQSKIAQLVQTLKGTGLFDDVRLMKSTREGFLAGNAYAFRMECVTTASQAGGRP